MTISLESRALTIAPMMGYSHAVGRRFWRVLHKDCLIYAEMIHVGALVLGKDSARFLNYHPNQGLVAYQLGGNQPELMAQAGAMIAGAGFHEINLNCGCPSMAVQAGAFGAVLMKNPQLVAACVNELSKSGLPVSVKCRINLDKNEDDEFLDRFIGIITQETATKIFHIHARNAVLKGLSPAQNRTIPRLNYERVLRLKSKFPNCHITINGGFRDWHQVRHYQQVLDGVMVGRVAVENPLWLLNGRDIKDIMAQLLEFCAQLSYDERADSLNFLNNMAHSIPNSRIIRQRLNDTVRIKSPEFSQACGALLQLVANQAH